jgi:FtsZ-binding cell division protein ZapB
MAASAIVSDQNVQEKIYGLQKLNLDTRLRQILDEATQLCSEGRHMEASALVEKAEAMNSLSSGNGPGLREVRADPKQESAPEASVIEQSVSVRLAKDITNGLTDVLVRAIQDLERHITGENSRLSSTFDQRLVKLQSSVENLQPLSERLDHLVQDGIAVQTKCEQLAATAASLREADARLDTEVGALRLQVHELSTSTSNRIDEVCRRIEGQEREISTANAGLSGLTSKVATAAERLERHANAIRGLHRGQQERVEALEKVAEVLKTIRSAPTTAEPIAL